MSSTPTRPVGRRGFLGAVGSAVAGAAAGSVATAAALSGGQESADAPALQPEASTRDDAGTTISPFGEHQPGVSAATAAAVDVVALDLLPALHRTHDRDALGRLLRIITGDVVALTQGRAAPGDPIPWLAADEADVSVTVGLGPRLLNEGWSIPNPPGWQRVPPMTHDRLESQWTGGDIGLFVMARDATTAGHVVRRLVADAAPFARQRWRQQGSWNGFAAGGRRMTGRNHFGQVDGSANPHPDSELFGRTVWIADGPWAGGTTVVLRRIRMDMPTWDALTRPQQERAMGRRLEDGAPLTGGGEFDDVDLAARDADGRLVIARHSHVRRSHPSLNGGARIFRRGANYEVVGAKGTEVGLLFSSYQADLAGQFVPLQTSLDEADELNEWTTAVGSAEFAVLPGFAEGGWLGEGLLG